MTATHPRLAASLPSVGRTVDPAHDLAPGLRDGNPTLTCRTCRRTWLPHQDRGLNGPCRGPSRSEKKR